MDVSDPTAADKGNENTCVQVNLMAEPVLQPHTILPQFNLELQPLPEDMLQTILEPSMIHMVSRLPILPSVLEDTISLQFEKAAEYIDPSPILTTVETLPPTNQTVPMKSSASKIVSSPSKLDEIFDLVCNGGGSLPQPRSPFNPNRVKVKIEPIFDDPHSIQSTSDDTKHFCSLCNKFFSAERYYKQHYNSVHVHNGPKKFKCMLCQRSFYTEKALQKHIDHEVYKPFNCNECNRTFNRKPDLIRHSFVHRKAKPFICIACHKSFIRSDQLQSHHKNCTVSKGI